ncbi:MAG: hypothetical protein Q9173_004482 [Seirophora scorigena]
MACALSKSWPTFLFFRFMVGTGASAPQAVVGGMYSDIYVDLVPRGRAVMILGLSSNIGPLIGPIIAGYTSIYKWQWIFWISLIMAGLIWPLLYFLPETFPPVITARSGKPAEAVPEDVKHRSPGRSRTNKILDLVLRVLSRPLRMFLEPIVLFTDLFLLYQYAIFYLNFEAYPIIFKVGLGALLAGVMFFAYDRFLQKNKREGKPWALSEEYRRLPLACAGGPLFAISQFWLGWTARPSIHWSVPALSGIFNGIGIDITFMALTNYLTDAYGIYSASALASSVLSRNIAAALLLPLTTYPMLRSPFCEKLKQQHGARQEVEQEVTEVGA